MILPPVRDMTDATGSNVVADLRSIWDKFRDDG